MPTRSVMDVPEVKELHKSAVGRMLIRKKVFWDNFLLYQDVRAEAIARTRTRMLAEQHFVQTATLNKLEMIKQLRLIQLYLNSQIT